ncbi:hypothetical protein [Actinomadura sp. 3N407]|uniref:hypothetical protein n=1 Tax=Actinomadura sp. 3N407 TaxID=3457423 RepID=UPI003FCEE550
MAGTLPWLWMVMTPASGQGGAGVPLVDLYAVLHDSFTLALVQIGGNLLVFEALGLFLPIRSPLGCGGVAAASTTCRMGPPRSFSARVHAPPSPIRHWKVHCVREVSPVRG